MKDCLKNYDCVLYHHFPSRSARVKWLIIELGLNDIIKTKPINLMKGEHMLPEFKTMNPMGTIPVLNITNKQGTKQTYCMSESGGICIFLTQMSKAINLQPDDNNILAMAQYHRVISMTTSSIDPLLWDIRMHEQLYPQRKRIQKVSDMARCNFTKNVVPAIEALLSDGGQHFICYPYHDQFTAADIILTFALYWADIYNLNTPIMRTYMKRMIGRDSFRKMTDEQNNNIMSAL